MAKLSVIVTSYNVEKYIDECLASLAAQTLQDIEFIVVDDGSTDSSPERIEKFAAEDPRFVPIFLATNSVGGVATAANAGLDRATAAYVGFADGDDLFRPTMFEELLAAATSSATDLAMCRYHELVDATGECREPSDAARWRLLGATLFDLDADVRKQFLRFVAVPWRKIYRREMLEREGIRFPVGDYFFEDNPFHWFSLVAASSIAVVPEVLVYHRVGRTGQTMESGASSLFKIFEHHATIREWLTARHLDSTYASALLNWVISQLDWIARRVTGADQQQLFDTLLPIFRQYPPPLVDEALREGSKGVLARQLCDALTREDFRAFQRALDPRRPEGLAAKALLHLREGGVRHTARVMARYGGQRKDRLLRSPRLGWLQVNRVDNRDVMFGLAVLQERLNSIESSLRRLEAASDHAAIDGPLDPTSTKRQ